MLHILLSYVSIGSWSSGSGTVDLEERQIRIRI